LTQAAQHEQCELIRRQFRHALKQIAALCASRLTLKVAALSLT
jgi:hypothetical protein